MLVQFLCPISLIYEDSTVQICFISHILTIYKRCITINYKDQSHFGENCKKIMPIFFKNMHIL